MVIWCWYLINVSNKILILQKQSPKFFVVIKILLINRGFICSLLKFLIFLTYFIRWNTSRLYTKLLNFPKLLHFFILKLLRGTFLKSFRRRISLSKSMWRWRIQRVIINNFSSWKINFLSCKEGRLIIIIKTRIVFNLLIAIWVFIGFFIVFMHVLIINLACKFFISVLAILVCCSVNIVILKSVDIMWNRFWIRVRNTLRFSA